MPSSTTDDRFQRRQGAGKQMIPALADAEHGVVTVDATWGTVQPMTLAPGVITVGELEVIEHLRDGGRLVDSRRPHFHEEATIEGAVNVPHPEVADRLEQLDLEPSRPTVFFCNGPQCTATPQAIRTLLQHGVPVAAVRYYRGGIHDWMTLGLPVVRGG